MDSYGLGSDLGYGRVHIVFLGIDRSRHVVAVETRALGRRGSARLGGRGFDSSHDGHVAGVHKLTPRSGNNLAVFF